MAAIRERFHGASGEGNAAAAEACFADVRAQREAVTLEGRCG